MIFGLFMAKLAMNYYYYSYYFIVGWWHPKSDPQKKLLAVWASNFLLESFRTWFGISGALCNNAHQPSLLASFSCALLDSSLLCSLFPLRKIHAKIPLAATHFCSFDLRFITGSGRSRIRSFSFRLFCVCVCVCVFFGRLLLLKLVSAVQSAVSALRNLEKPVVSGYVVSVSGGISYPGFLSSLRRRRKWEMLSGMMRKNLLECW
jgi:hypothetical protein